MNKISKSSCLLSLLIISGSAFAVAPARVPATGEAAGGGGAGATNGVAWPSPRFVAGSGVESNCITDKLTGLMWPKNGIIGFEATNGGGPIAQPNYASIDPNLNTITWAQALTAVANMNTAPTKLCGYSDWRLPNKVELKSLINYGAVNVVNWLKYGTGSSASPACNGACFSDLQGTNYWSSSTSAASTTNAWYVSFFNGSVNGNHKSGNNSVWPVRGGL